MKSLNLSSILAVLATGIASFFVGKKMNTTQKIAAQKMNIIIDDVDTAKVSNNVDNTATSKYLNFLCMELRKVKTESIIEDRVSLKTKKFKEERRNSKQKVRISFVDENGQEYNISVLKRDVEESIFNNSILFLDDCCDIKYQ